MILSNKIPLNIDGWFSDTKIIHIPKVQGNLVFDLGYLNNFSRKIPFYIKRPGMVLGAKTGPISHISNLLHEMSHFVEIDDKRCLIEGWGLKFPTIYIDGKIYDQSNTCQGSIREFRVIAIQMKIAEHIGRSSDWSKSTSSVVKFLNDSCYLGKFFNLPERISHDTWAKIHCAQSYVKELASRYKIEDIWDEWQRKCEIHDEHFKQ